MEKTNKSLKEWNAVVEALGHGLQTILIRKYPTYLEGFFLYPTISYSLKDDFLLQFNEKFRGFVEKNASPHKEDDKTQIKYYAIVEKSVEMSSRQISRLNNYHIWDKNHVNNYLNNKNGYVWLLRIYKLNEPYLAEFNRSILFVNLQKELALDGIVPVLNNEYFHRLYKKMGIND